MSKKINPKDQTEELNNARLEFILRNKEESQKLRELVCQDEKKRDEFTTALSSLGGKFNPEMKEHWDFLTKVLEIPFDKEFAEYIKKEEVPKAVNSVWRWLYYNMAIQHQRMADEECYNEGIPITLSHDEMKKEIIDMHCRDARGIFAELTNGRPAVHLLMGIDLTRNKGVILGEVEKLIDEYQTKLGVHEVSGKRLKWLPIIDDLLAVWDAWTESGEPARQSFPVIAKRLNVPESTVKARWHKAHVFIYGKKSETDPVRRREQRTDKALEMLCLKCTNPVCKNKHGWDEEIGCPAYVKMAGKNTQRERSHENLDSMADMQVLESYLEDEQE